MFLSDEGPIRSKCYTLLSISTVYRFTFYISICISILPIHSIEIQIPTCISFFDYMHGSVVESMLYTVITVQHFYWGIKFCLCLFMFIYPYKKTYQIIILLLVVGYDLEVKTLWKHTVFRLLYNINFKYR